jgi:hypothetical protein
MTTKTALKYYDFKYVLSHNAVYNFVVGARGLGKTYGAKKMVIRNYLRKGDQFIYLRRFATELKTKDTFFADIAHEFPNVQFRVQGHLAQVNRTGEKSGWETMGFFIPLSKAQSVKSVAYPKVKMIVFDEFIIEKGATHYLPGEATAFNNFYATVDRWQDRTRVLFLANSVSIMNPYFMEFDIRPDPNVEWVDSHDGFVCAHFAPSVEFGTGVFNTRFGKFIKDTDYADYAVNSQFRDNTDAMIGNKPSNARYNCTLETKTGTFSVWIDFTGPHYYIQEKRPKQEVIWTMLPERMDSNKIFVQYSDKTLQYLRSGFARGRVSFSSPQARNAFVGVFNR